MYSASASRQVRAIGFGGLPVVASVMIEALLLAQGLLWTLIIGTAGWLPICAARLPVTAALRIS